MSVKKTEEQIKAIEERGKIIVSASAGSGKTFVMIERILAHIREGADVKRMLAVTFTNKAAAQMREKLRRALIQNISASEGEERARLKEQLNSLQLAEICTIHSFCAKLIRSNFFLADVSPAFRIIDDAEAKALKLRAMNEVFEEAYATGGEEFQALLSVYFRGKKDAQLRSAVLSVWNAVRDRADYRSALETQEDKFQEICNCLAEEYISRAQFCFDEAEDIGVFFASRSNKAFAFCGELMAAALPLTQAKDLFELIALAQTPLKISSAPPSTKATGEERRLLLKLKGLSAFIKDVYKELAKLSSQEEEYARYTEGLTRARSLCALALKFDEAYSRLKQEAEALDYNDLEHYALKILANEQALNAVREKYDEVFVDEYQDVNPVQEKIVSLVGGEEVFLVGDAKQSIYAFRGSQSEYFLNKTKEFPHSLALSENFRSSSAVIEAVNRVFSYAMTRQTCGIDYATEGVMRGGARYGEHHGQVIFQLIPPKEKQESEPRGVYSVLNEGKAEPNPQAEQIVRLIDEELGKEYFDADEGKIKRVTFGDIAVLVRTTVAKDVQAIVSYLSERNVPVTTTAKTNVCDYWECRLILDWLSYLDNVEQDIPLAGAMLSRIGGFQESELSRIRLRFPSPYTFRAAAQEYREKMNDQLSQKLKQFQQKTERLRSLCCLKRASEMIGLLLSEGLEAEIAAKSEGKLRLKRVRRLAAEGENCSVNAFLQKLKNADNRVDFAESGGENAVKVLTMHAVKGLEYPVVILANLHATFHGAETSDVLYSPTFGFAPQAFDFEKKVACATLTRRAIAAEQVREELKGELNLFYVAMTRAKYRLYLLFRDTETALSPRYAKRFEDFIDFADCAQYFAPATEKELPPLERKALAYRPNEQEAERIFAVYRKPYAHQESVLLPVKDSATGLKRQERPAEREFIKQFEDTGEKSDIATGLAYHAFLEKVNFGQDAGQELARMQRENLLSPEQLSLLKVEKLEQILAMPCLQAVTGKKLFREQKFLARIPACEIPALNTTAKDYVILQGAIDLLCQEEQGYTLVDYKYSSRSEEALKQTYFNQILIYKKAIALTMGVREEDIRAKILNVLRLCEIEM